MISIKVGEENMKEQNIIFILFFMPMYFIMHLLICYIQVISTRDYFYGIYIKNIKIDEQVKQQIHKAYKKRIHVLFLIIVMATIISVRLSLNWILIFNIGMFIYLAMSYRYLRMYYLVVKQIKLDYLNVHQKQEKVLDETNIKVVEDTIFLAEKLKLKNKFKRLFLICVGLSLLSLLYQMMMYPTLPDEIITHWGITGEPDRFSPKSLTNVFMINMIDIPTVLVLAVATIEVLKSKIYLDESNIEVNRKKALAYLNGLGYSFLGLTLGLQLVTTTTPFFMINQLQMPISLIIAGIMLPLVCGVSLLYNWIRLSSVKSKDAEVNALSSNEDYWLYGFIYYNKQDPAFMVEKRFGAGWTMNMAHKKSIIFYALLLIPLIICVAVLTI